MWVAAWCWRATQRRPDRIGGASAPTACKRRRGEAGGNRQVFPASPLGDMSLAPLPLPCASGVRLATDVGGAGGMLAAVAKGQLNGHARTINAL